MTARHKVSSAALDLIKRFEGYRRKAARLADGRWTIGYGHTLSAREGAEVSPDDAEALLIYDVRPVAAAVETLTYTPLTQNQFDALVAFAFNVGIDNFRRSSVLRHVNEGALIQAACAIEMWRKADFEGERIVVDALVRRRAAEKTLFLTPTDGWIPAPSSILLPKVDYDVGQALPRSSAELETSMIGDVAQAHRATEDKSASVAAADALTERLNRLLPEPGEAAPTLFNAETSPSPASGPVELESATPVQETAPTPEPGPEFFKESDEAVAQSQPIDLTRRVVWREAPKDAEASRLLGGGLSEMTPMTLLALFLAGLAIFAGAIVWGLSAQSPGAISWVLGLLGIVCVVSAVYVYLERLGGRKD